MAEQGNLEYKTKSFNVRFKPSLNSGEYSDGFGGRVKSGETRTADETGYIIINHEDNG